MGDRANVKVVAGDSEVFLYTHWNGTELPTIVQNALDRGQRWDDHSYLARIIFCEMVKDEVDGETGFGISSVVGDGDNRIITVNVDKQTVSYSGGDYTFRSFLDVKNPEWK